MNGWIGPVSWLSSRRTAIASVSGAGAAGVLVVSSGAGVADAGGSSARAWVEGEQEESRNQPVIEPWRGVRLEHGSRQPDSGTPANAILGSVGDWVDGMDLGAQSVVHH